MNPLVAVVVVLAAVMSTNAQTAPPTGSKEIPQASTAAELFLRGKNLAPAFAEPLRAPVSEAATSKAELRRAFVESPHLPPAVFPQPEVAPEAEMSFALQRPAGVGVAKAPPPDSTDAGSGESGTDDPGADDAGDDPLQPTGFQWKPAIKQSLLLLAIQHGYAMTQPKTRRELKGPFFKDYFESLSNLGGWADGGRFFTNYIAHPLQGAASGFIQIQNDPKGIRQQFGGSKRYWTSRLKAMGWSAAMSTQFELGPISQASIGNVGKARKLTYVDLVITPTVGTALIVGEDMLDRFVVRWVERRTSNLYLRVATRMILNPSRSCANMLRFKKPWHRDTAR